MRIWGTLGQLASLGLRVLCHWCKKKSLEVHDIFTKPGAFSICAHSVAAGVMSTHSVSLNLVSLSVLSFAGFVLRWFSSLLV